MQEDQISKTPTKQFSDIAYFVPKGAFVKPTYVFWKTLSANNLFFLEGRSPPALYMSCLWDSEDCLFGFPKQSWVEKGDIFTHVQTKL